MLTASATKLAEQCLNLIVATNWITGSFGFVVVALTQFDSGSFLHPKLLKSLYYCVSQWSI